jgi:hypothetical protein
VFYPHVGASFWLFPGICVADNIFVNVDSAIKAEADGAGEAHRFQQGKVKSGGQYGAEGKADQGDFGNVDKGSVHCDAPLE